MSSDEELARGVAEICGPHSGAARAVALLDELRAQGRDALLVREGGTWFVIHDRCDDAEADQAP